MNVSPPRGGLFFCKVDTGALSGYQFSMKEIVRYRRCFVCGDENEHGLQARFFYDGEQAVSELKALDTFEGYKGIYHGGIISAMLDEVMIKAILARDIFAVTAEITIRYHRPIETGASLHFTGRVVRHSGRVYYTEGEVCSSDGTKFASAHGKYLEARPDLKARLQESLDRD
jgi:uncharacterized protein (TIGR00369 family)